MVSMEDYKDSYVQESFEKYQLKYRKRKLIELIEKYEPKHILEIGCGTDPLFSYTNDDITYTIIEPIEEFCDIAKKKNDKGKHRIINDYFDDSFNTKYSKNESYDMVICSSLLHEIDEKKLFLKGLVNVASKDTIIHINVPNANSLHRVLAKEAHLIDDVHSISKRDRLFNHSLVFDMELLKKMVDDSGIQVVESGSYFCKPFSHDQMLKMLEDRIIDQNILDSLYELEKYIPGFGSEIYINGKIK